LLAALLAALLAVLLAVSLVVVLVGVFASETFPAPDRLPVLFLLDDLLLLAVCGKAVFSIKVLFATLPVAFRDVTLAM